MAASPDDQPQDLLVTHALTRRFGGVTAVSSVDLAVREGQISGIIGPNGAGKTTLFNMIAGTLKPTSGDIYLRGMRISRLPENRIVRLGVARTFQNTRLFPNMTVLDNVLSGRSPHMRSDAISVILGAPWARNEEHASHERVAELLDFVGISHLAGRLARQISYGDQRRVAIARALATEPALLLLDEPAAGMNDAETADLIGLLKRIDQRGITTLLIEHDMSVVMQVCHWISVLDHGEAIAQGPPLEIQKNQRVIEAYLGGGETRIMRRRRRLRSSESQSSDGGQPDA